LTRGTPGRIFADLERRRKMAKKTTRKQYRSAVTGEFIPPAKAKKKPREAELETIKIPAPKKKRK